MDFNVIEVPNLNSFAGLLMTAKFVKNWYSLLILYSTLIPKVTIRFRDGEQVTIYKRNKESNIKLQGGFAFPQGTLTWLQNSLNFDKFYEFLYKRYLIDKGFQYGTDDIVTLTPMNLKIKIFKPYSFVLDEVFIMRVYGEPDLKGRTVIDIGASIGDSSLYFSKLGAEMVYAYEMDSERYNLARQNIKMNKLDERIKIFNIAANSELLDSIILQNNLSNVFLKLDCEGCEYQIFSEIDKRALERVNDVVMEYHKDPSILMMRLKDHGFHVKKKGTLIFGNRKSE